MLAVFALSLVFAALGGLLGLVHARLRPVVEPLTDRIDALLPQTQCAQCGYPGCRPYAAAIAAGEAGIDRCPPGGTALVSALADLLELEAPPAGGEPVPAADRLARIDETACIGCGLCLPACPVDAILGAPRFLHTVLSAECTGCGLCLPPCPVDCITLEAGPAVATFGASY